jgi:hypothetical protein
MRQVSSSSKGGSGRDDFFDLPHSEPTIPAYEAKFDEPIEVKKAR